MHSPDPTDAVPDPGVSDEELARILLRAVAALVAVLLAAGIASAASRLSEEEVAQEDPAMELAGPGAIGPLPGTPLATYLPSRDHALAEAHGTRAAIVSFTEFRTAAEAARVIAPIDPLRLLVAVPGGVPAEAEPGADLAALAKTQRQAAAEEKAALEQLLPSVEDPDFARQYRADIDRLAALITNQAAADNVVFAVVVIASADRLRAVAAKPDVRVVDVASGDRLPPRATAVGIRPEETLRAGEPPNRPV